MPNIVVISIVLVVAIAIIIFLILRNKRDSKSENPDASNSVENEIMEQKRNKHRV